MAKNTRRPTTAAAPAAVASSSRRRAPRDTSAPSPRDTSAAAARDASRPATITPAAGETFDELAARAGVDPAALFAANRDVLGSNTDRVAIGTALTVPTE